MIQLVTFADENMQRSLNLCVLSALKNNVDYIRPWNKDRLTRLGYVEEYPEIFTQPENSKRAWGWWAWKPVVIDETLRSMNDGDYLIYADAGIEFIDNVKHIIDRMDQDVFLFGNNWEHAHWCKRDAVEAVMGPTAFTFWPWERFGKQVQASVMFIRKTEASMSLVGEWFQWCLFESGRLVNDSPSRKPNHPEFQEHRHDQAILTTLAYREGVKLHYWPATYNNGAFNYEKLPYYASDNYPILFHHHRRRDSEWV